MLRRDQENEALRDAVDAEGTKIARLETLIKQYSSSVSGVSGAGSGAGASTVGESKRATHEVRSVISGGRSVASAVSNSSSATRTSASRDGGSRLYAHSNTSNRAALADGRSVEESVQKMRLSKTAGHSYRNTSDRQQIAGQTLKSATLTTSRVNNTNSRASHGSGSRDEDELYSGDGGAYADVRAPGRSGSSSTASEDEDEGDEPNPLPSWILEKQAR